MKTSFVRCSSALSQTGIGGVDFVLNPYTGCEHGCVYCYAVFMKRYSGHREEWGEFLDVKANMPAVLRRQLAKAKGKNILISSVTDPYQPAEREYEITRKCLLALSGAGADVSILTKSRLVLRDIDILSASRVGMTVTTSKDDTSRLFEPRASPPSERFAALEKLRNENIETYAFFGPILPYFSDTEKEMEAVFSKLQNAGVEHVIVDRLNFRGGVFTRIEKMLARHHPELVEAYREISAHTEGYGTDLKKKVLSVIPEGMEAEILF